MDWTHNPSWLPEVISTLWEKKMVYYILSMYWDDRYHSRRNIRTSKARLECLFAGWPWSSHFTSLCLSSLSIKYSQKYSSPRGIVRIRWDHGCRSGWLPSYVGFERKEWRYQSRGGVDLNFDSTTYNNSYPEFNNYWVPGSVYYLSKFLQQLSMDGDITILTL